MLNPAYLKTNFRFTCSYYQCSHNQIASLRYSSLWVYNNFFNKTKTQIWIFSLCPNYFAINCDYTKSSWYILELTLICWQLHPTCHITAKMCMTWVIPTVGYILYRWLKHRTLLCPYFWMFTVTKPQMEVAGWSVKHYFYYISNWWHFNTCNIHAVLQMFTNILWKQ